MTEGGEGSCRNGGYGFDPERSASSRIGGGEDLEGMKKWM